MNMNIKILTEQEVKEYGLKKTTGMSKQKEPIFKQIHVNGEYLNIIYLPELKSWVSLPSYRSISQAIKQGKKSLKENNMTKEQDNELNTFISSLTDTELIDKFFILTQTQDEDLDPEKQSMKYELIDIIKQEIRDRDLNNTYSLEEWVKTTNQDTSSLNLDLTETETEDNQNQRAFNELYRIAISEINALRTSSYKKEKLKAKIQEEFITTGTGHNDLFSEITEETQDQDKDISIQDDPEKLKYIQSLKSILPSDIDINTLSDLNLHEIQELIKNSRDTLLNDKVQNYLKAQDIHEKLVNKEKKETTLTESFDSHTLSLNDILTIESKIKQQLTEHEQEAHDYLFLLEKIEDLTNKNLKHELLNKALQEELKPTEFSKQVISLIVNEKKEALKKELKDSEVINLLKQGNIIVNSEDEVLWYDQKNKNFMLDEKEITEDEVIEIFKQQKEYDILRGE